MAPEVEAQTIDRGLALALETEPLTHTIPNGYC
jgi:hypothetical protein